MKTADAVAELKAKIGAQAIVSEADCCGQVTLELRKEHLREALLILKETLGYEVLMDFTGVDYLEPVPQTKVIYWLHNPTDYGRIRLSVFAKREESLPSIVDLWAGADWYERELFDLFGVNFEGHPYMTRLLMPDNWMGHPLRRDYPLTEEPVHFKHGVRPKVPSQIINIGKSTRNISQLGSSHAKSS